MGRAQGEMEDARGRGAAVDDGSRASRCGRCASQQTGRGPRRAPRPPRRPPTPCSSPRPVVRPLPRPSPLVPRGTGLASPAGPGPPPRPRLLSGPSAPVPPYPPPRPLRSPPLGAAASCATPSAHTAAARARVRPPAPAGGSAATASRAALRLWVARRLSNAPLQPRAVSPARGAPATVLVPPPTPLHHGRDRVRPASPGRPARAGAVEFAHPRHSGDAAPETKRPDDHKEQQCSLDDLRGGKREMAQDEREGSGAGALARDTRRGAEGRCGGSEGGGNGRGRERARAREGERERGKGRRRSRHGSEAKRPKRARRGLPPRLARGRNATHSRDAVAMRPCRLRSSRKAAPAARAAGRRHHWYDRFVEMREDPAGLSGAAPCGAVEKKLREEVCAAHAARSERIARRSALAARGARARAPRAARRVGRGRARGGGEGGARMANRTARGPRRGRERKGERRGRGTAARERECVCFQRSRAGGPRRPPKAGARRGGDPAPEGRASAPPSPGRRRGARRSAPDASRPSPRRPARHGCLRPSKRRLVAT